MSRQAPLDHPWRTPFPEDKATPIEIPQLTRAEISAIKIMRWRKYKWASIAKILDCPAFVAMRAMSPNYRPLKES